MIQLHKHHEELRTVWGDIEETIPIVVPQKAKQPENLKVTLLPFQQESLYWMRKQEQGIWHGGMLAVCHFYIPYPSSDVVRFLVSPLRTRWGEYFRINVMSAYSDLLFNRMGKTIQIISLLVSDPQKPNLVVA